MEDKVKYNQEEDHKMETLHKNQKICFMIKKNIKAQKRIFKK